MARIKAELLAIEGDNALDILARVRELANLIDPDLSIELAVYTGNIDDPIEEELSELIDDVLNGNSEDDFDDDKADDPQIDDEPVPANIVESSHCSGCKTVHIVSAERAEEKCDGIDISSDLKHCKRCNGEAYRKQWKPKVVDGKQQAGPGKSPYKCRGI